MAEELDVNSRLLARRRAVVPPRETSLLKREREEEPPETKPAIPVPAMPVAPVLETKRQDLISSTIRVEAAIEEALKQLCSSHRITKETFLEAAFQIAQEHEEFLALVLAAARARRETRKQAGLQRRAESMSSKYL